jgi:UDP-N-acetyl-2-amino-2-deoxyglucuronate dehydrogenase
MSVRVGFLGAGLIATYHSKSLRWGGADITRTGVYDPDTRRAEQFAAASGATVCATEAEVLDGCDAVYVCTWTAEHPRLVQAAVERGLGVFCEKPLAVDLESAAGMTASVAASGVVNQVGLVLRRSPAFTFLRHLVTSPESGRVMAVVFRDDQYIPTQGMYGSTWRGDPAKAGSGTLLEHSIHDIDVLEWVAGPVTSASARSAHFHELAGIEDAVAVSFAFAGGAVGTLTSVWHDILERPSLRRVEVFCERGWFAMEEDDWFGPVHWTRLGGGRGSLSGPDLESAVTDAGLTLDNPDRAFIDCVASDRPAHPDFATALRAHVVADAVYRSAASGGSAIAVPAPA